MSRLFKASLVPILLLGHTTTQLALALPDETWRSWTRIHVPGAVAALTLAFFVLRLTFDLMLCAWILGRHRIRAVLPLRRAH
jgi:hypothetical protein